MSVADASEIPVAVWLVHDRRYGTVETFIEVSDAQRERMREPDMMDLHAYQLVRSGQAPGKEQDR